MWVALLGPPAARMPARATTQDFREAGVASSPEAARPRPATDHAKGPATELANTEPLATARCEYGDGRQQQGGP